MKSVSNRYNEQEDGPEGVHIRAHKRAIGDGLYLFAMTTAGGRRSIHVTRITHIGNETVHFISYTYHTTRIGPIEPPEEGALSGHAVTCTCGDVQNVSLPNMAEKLSKAHEDWHRRRGE